MRGRCQNVPERPFRLHCPGSLGWGAGGRLQGDASPHCHTYSVSRPGSRPQLARSLRGFNVLAAASPVAPGDAQPGAGLRFLPGRPLCH